MQKKNLVGKRVAVNSDLDWFFKRGQTGKVVGWANDGVLDVIMDGYLDSKKNPQIFPFAPSELYFPDDIQGYNQKCFQNP